MSCDLRKRENISTRWSSVCKNKPVWLLFFCASKEKCREIVTFHHVGQGGPGDTLIRCACIIIPKIITLLNNFPPQILQLQLILYNWLINLYCECESSFRAAGSGACWIYSTLVFIYRHKSVLLVVTSKQRKTDCKHPLTCSQKGNLEFLLGLSVSPL